MVLHRPGATGLTVAMFCVSLLSEICGLEVLILYRLAARKIYYQGSIEGRFGNRPCSQVVLGRSHSLSLSEHLRRKQR